MMSLWEQQSFQHYDVIIVGAGITGLSAAASLVEADASLRVLVMERGTLPTGASTRNAGFACFGSLTELLADIKTLGPEGMLPLVERRWKGLQKTIARLGASNIDLQRKGGWELLYNPASSYEEQLQAVNDLLRPIFTEDVFSDRSDQLDLLGFGKFKGLLFNQFEGQVDTGKLMHRLWSYCAAKGVAVLTGTDASGFEEHSSHVDVRTPAINFRCQQLLLCTNAFTPELLKVDLAPGRGTVLVIEPEHPLSFEGTFHYDEGYFYFRDYYGKVIFGGGRNVDKLSETTTDFSVNPEIFNRLKADIEGKILPGQQYRITHQWSGIMAFGESKQPIIQRTSDRIALGVRLGGMGVAIGSIVGDELAQLVIPSFQ